MTDNLQQGHSNECESDNAELPLSELQLGNFIRQDKFAKVYSVVASEWTAAVQWEAHVFEIQRNQQLRFFERMVWPKKRKSKNYETDFTRDLEQIFVYRIVEEIGPSAAKRPKARRKRAKPVSTTAAISNTELIGDNNPGNGSAEAPIYPVAYVTQVFSRYCDRIGEPIPELKGGTSDTDLITLAQSDWYQDESIKGMWEDANLKVNDLASERANESARATGDGGEGARLGRRSRRPLPHDRDVEMIIDLAKIIKDEPIRYLPDGRPQLGRSFFLKHLFPPTHWPEGWTLEELASKQQDWTVRLTRLIERVPRILKNLTKQRAASWQEAIPRVLQLFGDVDGGDLNKSNIGSRWPHTLRWMIKNTFESADSNEVQSLAPVYTSTQGLSITYGDRATTSWLLQIRHHVGLHKWAAPEMRNGAGDAVLLQMLHTHTRRELVAGMLPLLERMRWMSELTAKYWKGHAACCEFSQAMLSPDARLNRSCEEHPSGPMALANEYFDPSGVLTLPYNDPSTSGDEVTNDDIIGHGIESHNDESSEEQKS
ncbi:hypothetical protein PG993_011371 [Apiospora rasikravindrae]|uniref:Uncharacterized protein n=1 Tax=Apiospora rasikravindrae TaxID=990691 RepID=A0ABR1SE06_9PEZI